jgi:alpha-beta hydrolase superfamily lysophospholipase
MIWTPDVLPGFSHTPIDPATLVRLDDAPAAPRAVVLHVHGYNDYFFQVDLARFFADEGCAFYAVDLRRAGRSLRPGDHPHDMADVAEPGEDISAAADAVCAAHPGLPLIVHAHSTGALTASIWAADRAHTALAGLILNSPLFGRILTRGQRIRMRALPLIARTAPQTIVSSAPSVYARHLHVDGGGRWDFDTSWKRPSGVPVTARWLAAVVRAQGRIARGLGLTIPVLVARSAQTGPERDDNPRLNEQDIVVDVDAVARLAPKLGDRVEEIVVPGAIHDVSLSADGPRGVYLDGVRAWLSKVLA